MANAAILIGEKVKRTTNLSNLSFNSKSGFLVKFTFNKTTYVHSFKDDFRKDDQNTKLASGGYYVEAMFLERLVDKISLEELSAQKLKFEDLENAEKDDKIIVQKLKIVSPYNANDFCVVNNYSWNFDPTTNIFDDNSNILIPATAAVDPKSVSIANAAKDFYTDKIKLIQSADFPVDSKDPGAYLIALMALRINRINKDVFSLFTGDPDLGIYISSQNQNWGSANIFVNPTLQDLQNYYNYLTNFYNRAYSNQLLIKDAPNDIKLLWLVNVLSASGLSILPIDTKLELLKQIVESHVITGSHTVNKLADMIATNKTELILNIVDSVALAPTQTDYFLNKLISIEYTGILTDTTLFERLYNSVGDNRIGTITSGLINSNDDRKHLVQSLYNIWKISAYYPYYASPSYTQPAKERVFPESFFMTPSGKKYYDPVKAPGILVYQTVETTLTSYNKSFEYKISDKNIVVTKVVQDSIKTEHPSTITISLPYGTYHFYQPLAVIGYKSDYLVSLPQKNCIPAFFLKYAYDFKEEKEFDFGLKLLIDLTLNFTILGEVNDLNYLSELSEIAEASSLPANSPVLIWDTVLGISKTVQFTAGSYSAIFDYISTQTDDDKIKEFYQNLSAFLGALSIAAVCSDIYAQQKLINAARNVIAKSNELGDAVTLSRTAITEIEIIGEIDELINLMQSKISNLNVGNKSIILNKYNSIIKPEEQLSFFNHFYFVDDNDIIWSELSKFYIPDSSISTTSRTLIDDWIEINQLKEERKSIDFLDAYARFKYIKPFEFNHIRYLKGTTGGHWFLYVTNDLNDSSVLYKIVSQDLNINTTIPSNLRTKIYNINGHIYYENLWRFNPNLDINDPKVLLVNGLGVTKKSKHFVINPLWNEQKLAEEMSFAFKNKIVNISKKPIEIKSDGVIKTAYEIIYGSSFSDGTKVTITYRSEDVDPISRKFVKDRVSLFSIDKPKP